MTDIVLGVRVTADGKELVSTANASEDALKRLRGEADRNTDTARRLSDQQKNLASGYNQLREAVARHAAELGGGNAIASNLIGTIARLSLGLTLAAAAAGVFAKAHADGAREAHEMNRAIALTGNFAGTTRGQMIELARSISDSGDMTIATSKQIVTQLTASGQIGAEALKRVAALSEDYAAATGRQAREVGPELVRLFADPAKGAEQLNKQYHFISVAQLKHIEELTKMGELGRAQLALADLAGPRFQGTRQQLGFIESAWNSVQKAASNAWDAMLNVGRPKTTGQDLSDQTQTVMGLLSQRGVRPEVIAAAKGRLSELQGRFDAEQADSTAQAAAAAANVREHALARQKEERARVAGGGRERIERESKNARGQQLVSAWMNDYAKELEAENRAIDTANKLAEAQQSVLRELHVAQSTQLQDLQQEITFLGLSEREREKRIALLRIERAERAALSRLDAEHSPTYQQDARRIMADSDAARAAVSAGLDALASAKATQKAFEDAKLEARRFDDELQRSVSDGLMRGFEAGKGFAENFRETLVNMFKTLVLTPIIKWVISPVTGAITTALGGLGIPGLGGAGGGNGGGNGGGFSLSNLSGISNLFGNSGAAMEVLNAGGGFGGAASTLFGGNAGLVGGGMDLMGLGSAASGFGVGGGAAAGGAGAMGAIGAAVPYVGMALAAYSLLKGKKKTPGIFTGYDAPSLSFGMGGLNGTIYGNNQKGERWAGEQFAGTFGAEAQNTYAQFAQLGSRLGVDTSRLSSYNATVDAGSFTQHGEVLPRVLEQLSQQLARQIVPNFDAVARAGETAAQTLTRLADEQEKAAEQQKKRNDFGPVMNRMNAALGLGDSMRDLWLSDVSPLTARERLDQAQRVADQYAGAARAGDVSAFGAYGGAARGYLSEAARFYGTSTTAYRNIFEARQAEAGSIIGDTLNSGINDFRALGVPLSQIAGSTGELVPLLRQLLEETKSSNDALRLFALSRDSATFIP